MTTSELSDQSHSASSGRGSAEDGDDVDEEIRMINATPLTAVTPNSNSTGSSTGRMPDSGIQQDADTQSLQSVQNHQEYLARLGIEPNGGKAVTKAQMAALTGPNPDMQQYSDQETGPTDSSFHPPHTYHKLEPMEPEESQTTPDGTREFRYVQKSPGQGNSLSSVINSEEEFAGSYNWDYLLDWGPQYQPLANVFAEIAKLKDDSIKPPKKQPPINRPQPNGIGFVPAMKTIMAPPLLTSAPPKATHVSLAQPGVVRPNATSNGMRSSYLSSQPSHPRSPISHESSFTSPAHVSPSFTPSLSPLATRSPSHSPLVATPPSSGHNSDHNTPVHIIPSHRTNPYTVTLGGRDMEADQEIHI